MSDWYPVTGFYFSVKFIPNPSSSSLSLTTLVSAGLSALASSTDSSFKEISGLEMKIDTQTIEEGGLNNYVWKAPKQATFSNLVLKRGVTPTISLISTWVQTSMNSVLSSSITPLCVIILLMNEKGLPLSGWACLNAFPVRWKVSDLDSMKNEVLIEEIEFSYTNYYVIPVANVGV